MPTTETLYLQLLDLTRKFDALEVRHDAMESFIKDQYPNYFAGEVGTIADPELKPVNLTVGQEPRDDPATCTHPENRHYKKSVSWQKKAVTYCDACGALIPEKEA